MKKDKWTNNDLQNTTQKTKIWATRTPLKSGRGTTLTVIWMSFVLDNELELGVSTR
jgi:hypothetical protein